MAHFDMPMEELSSYKPQVREEADFDQFWMETLRESRSYALNPVFKEIDHPFKHLKIYDVTYSGFGGNRIRGWFLRPLESSRPLPCYLEFIGYGGGRSLPHEWIAMASAGMAHFVMDTRGQGSTWSHGDTPDAEPVQENGQYPGFMTRGILSEKNYYYRRVFTDAVRAFDCLLTRDDVDASRIAMGGGSQGGGITIAAAGLIPEAQIVFPDVPFLCHFHKAIRMTDSHPYAEIREFLKTHRTRDEQVHRTLSYFDGVNFAKRAKARAVFSTALMDDICPPSTVFAAYNHYAGEKEIKVWDFNGHEGGGAFQKQRQLQILCDLWNL